jgi:hypothetical protein
LFAGVLRVSHFIVNRSFCLVDLAFGFKLLVAGGVAGSFLSLADNFICCAFYVFLGNTDRSGLPAGSRQRAEVGQMYLVHEIGMRFTGEDSRIERYAKFELEVGMSRLDDTLFVSAGRF